MFMADSASSIDSCLAVGILFSEDSLTCSVVFDFSDVLALFSEKGDQLQNCDIIFFS